MYINWLEVIGLAAAIGFATYVITFVLGGVVFFVLIGWAQGDILRNTTDRILTKQMVERELAIRHPRLYNAYVSLPAFCLSLGLMTFIIAIFWQLAQKF